MAARTMIRGNSMQILIPTLLLCMGLFIHSSSLLNHDVAWFAWGSREWLHGAVIGKDITDPNFPLAFIIYAPAAALAGTIPLELTIRLWPLVLTAFAIALAWQDVPERSRILIFAVLAAFVVFAWPREFAQREQIAMLLVFPYVIPADRRGWRAIVIGAFGGIGFAIKPYFLIAWLLIEIGRRPLRLEQISLMSIGALYATSLIVFFPTFIFEMLPETLEVYGAFNRIESASFAFLPLALAIIVLILAIAEKDRLAKGLALAAFGFGVAGALQLKFYPYQFVPTWGFIMLALTAMIPSRSRAIAVSIVFVAIMGQARPAWAWWHDEDNRGATQPLLLQALRDARTFAVVGVHPYPAFPTAIDAEQMGARFIGTASSNWFLPAAAKGNERAIVLARQQMLIDLRQRPDVVLVDTNWRRHTEISRTFDGLQLLLADPDVGREWTRYRQFGSVGSIKLYHRR